MKGPRQKGSRREGEDAREMREPQPLAGPLQTGGLLDRCSCARLGGGGGGMQTEPKRGGGAQTSRRDLPVRVHTSSSNEKGLALDTGVDEDAGEPAARRG